MRSTIPVLSAATAVLALVTVASCTSTAGAEPTPDPNQTPPALLLAAEPGPACGTVQLDILGQPMEVYQAITKESVNGEDVGQWIRQRREPASRIDSIVPSGYWVVYRAQAFQGPDVYTEPVQTEQCPEPTPEPTVEPTATPTTEPTAAPTPTVATPEPTGSPVPAEKDAEGGLAATGA